MESAMSVVSISAGFVCSIVDKSKYRVGSLNISAMYTALGLRSMLSLFRSLLESNGQRYIGTTSPMFEKGEKHHKFTTYKRIYNYESGL